LNEQTVILRKVLESLDVLHAKVESMDRRLDAVQGEVVALRQEVHDLRKDMDDMRRDMDDMRKEMDDMRKDMDNMRRDMDARLTALHESVIHVERKVEAGYVGTLELSVRVRTLERRVDGVENDLSRIQVKAG